MKFGVVALLLSATIVIGIAVYETHALFPAPSHARAEGIVWQGRTFVTRRDFARWLRARGTTYAAWARLHPSLAGVPAGRARAERAGEKSSKWSARNVGLAVLAGIVLLVAFVRRRWPDSLESATYAVGSAARRAAPPAKRGARTSLRWTKSAALLTARKAESGPGSFESRGPELRRIFGSVESLRRQSEELDSMSAFAATVGSVFPSLSASAAKGGARLMLGPGRSGGRCLRASRRLQRNEATPPRRYELCGTLATARAKRGTSIVLATVVSNLRALQPRRISHRRRRAHEAPSRDRTVLRRSALNGLRSHRAEGAS
jgi:hypothetical protein